MNTGETDFDMVACARCNHISMCSTMAPTPMTRNSGPGNTPSSSVANVMATYTTYSTVNRDSSRFEEERALPATSSAMLIAKMASIVSPESRITCPFASA